MEIPQPRGLDMPIDETNVRGKKRIYAEGTLVYKVLAASYDPVNEHGPVYDVKLERLTEEGVIEEAEKEVKIRYFFESKVPLKNEAGNPTLNDAGEILYTYVPNDSARATVRKIGRIVYGDALQTPPLAEDIIGVIVVGDTKVSKTGYPLIYEYTAPPLGYLEKYMSKAQFANDGQYYTMG